MTAIFDAAVASFDTADILMNNAGIDASVIPVAELSTEVFDTAIRTNLYGALYLPLTLHPATVGDRRAGRPGTRIACRSTSTTWLRDMVLTPFNQAVMDGGLRRNLGRGS